MILLLILFILLASPAYAENNKLLAVNLTGAPNSFANELHESVSLYIESDTAWNLEASAKSLKAVYKNNEIFLPPERISIRVNNGNWLKLQEYSQCLYFGSGPTSLTLEYRFDPYWDDKLVAENYETEIMYMLNSGSLYTSFCNPKDVKPGDVARIIFANEKLKEADIKIYKGDEILFHKAVNDCREISVDTKYADGTNWPSGEYRYEVTGKESVVTKGSFTLVDMSKWGVLQGNIRNIAKNDQPFIEIYNDVGELISRKAGAAGESFSVQLQEGSYSLCAGTQNGYKASERVNVLAGEVINRDIFLNPIDGLKVEASLSAETIKEGSRGTLSLDLCNLSVGNIKDIRIEMTLPEGVVWSENGQTVRKSSFKEVLESKEEIEIDADFVVLPSVKEGTYPIKIRVSAYTKDDTPIEIEKTCILKVTQGLFSEPGILIGEASEGFYLADGSFIDPDENFFSLQLEPDSYGLLIGNQPHILNVSKYSERIKLQGGRNKKFGLLEFKANLAATGELDFGVKGFYDTDKLKLAFIYPYILPKGYSYTPYPTWATKSSILDKTPWQFSYEVGDFKIGAGTVYSASPLRETYASIALVGAELDLAPEDGLQCKLTGGFYLETKKEDEFLADGTTGPFVLTSLPKEGSVRVFVESRNSYNQVIKTYSLDFYVDKKSVKLKRPLVQEDQLGLNNYLIVSYLCETGQKSDKFFGGGHIGFKEKENSIYLYRHLEDQGLMGNLKYRNLSLKGSLGRYSQDATALLKTLTTNHKVRLFNAKETSISYQLDYDGTWDSNLYILVSKGQNSNRGEFTFNFENRLVRAMIKQKLTMEKGDFTNFNSEYFFYSGSIKWPKNLVFSASREGFNGKKIDTFSTRMMYKILGFSGYVEGVWRNPREGKPKIAVSLAHNKVPLTVSAEWEHISPEFSLLELVYDTKSVWTKISLCNEKANLKKTLGVTVLPKNSLLFVAVNDDDIKTEYHLPLSKTAIKLAVTGNLETDVVIAAAQLDVALSKRSQLGVEGIYHLGLKDNFRLQGFYRFKTDNFQLETRLSEQDTGIYLTYLIPLGKSSK